MLAGPAHLADAMHARWEWRELPGSRRIGGWVFPAGQSNASLLCRGSREGWARNCVGLLLAARLDGFAAVREMSPSSFTDAPLEDCEVELSGWTDTRTCGEASVSFHGPLIPENPLWKKVIYSEVNRGRGCEALAHEGNVDTFTPSMLRRASFYACGEQVCVTVAGSERWHVYTYVHSGLRAVTSVRCSFPLDVPLPRSCEEAAGTPASAWKLLPPEEGLERARLEGAER